MSSDLTFLTNEPGKALLDRFHALLGKNTRLFDCLVGYFFISGFYKLYPSLEQTEAIRILIGLKTDATVFESLERGKERQEALFKSLIHLRWCVERMVLAFLEWPLERSLVGRFLGHMASYQTWKDAQELLSRVAT